MNKIYLDYTATTPVDRRVIDAMSPYLDGTFGNASSIHAFGREAKASLENGRDKLAGFLGVRSSELFFTSGGTESDNTALLGIAAKCEDTRKKHIVVSSIEHHAILHGADSLRRKGFKVSIVHVDPEGFVSSEEIEKVMTEETILVSIIHANNEIGSVQRLSKLSGIVHSRGALLHTDAVQSFCKIPLDLTSSGVDLASFSAHKLYGPKGIGALYVRRGVDVEPLLHGGAQERNRRPGTESVFMAVGFAKAAELASAELSNESTRLSRLNTSMRTKISEEVPEAIFNSPGHDAIPNILSVSIDSSKMEIDGEALIINMDLEGIAVSSGSACSSGSLQPSHVIKALGRDDATTMATVRFSFGRFTTEEEVVTAVDHFIGIVRRIGKRKKVISPVS